jgi:DNA-dependent metalloprotease WSS1
MPGGWERINNKKSTPNKNIVFIKPLPGPYEKTSQDFLERIAAQCLPIMNKHHLAVVSLEEYEPNREFWGKASPPVVPLLFGTIISCALFPRSLGEFVY